MFEILSRILRFDGFWLYRCRTCGCKFYGLPEEDRDDPCWGCLEAAGGTHAQVSAAYNAWYRNGRRGDALALLRCIMSLPGSDAPTFDLLKLDESRPYEPGNVRVRPTPWNKPLKR
jgi:hypothetical protein